MKEKIDLTKILTETRNPATLDIDVLPTIDMVRKMNDEDLKVPAAVREQLAEIAELIDIIAAAYKKGGRLFYIGAGTSGRLGILDASECPPTYGVSAEMVQGLIAGGLPAVFAAQEGAEDSLELAEQQLREKNLNATDVVVGLAASGRTPYVIAGLKFAKAVGCKTGSIACTNNSEIGLVADVAIELLTGPEVVTGSTRMKAGTAQKLVLNMLSTGSMIKSGKVFSNLMVDVQSTNKKLVERAKRIAIHATGCDYSVAEQAILTSGGSVKIAIVMIIAGVDVLTAKRALEENNGFTAAALKSLVKNG
ncbi:MAG: N-acetylmuramic acid 6-phosphate etherase [Negativicutes bacterium]|jgi:N-acetylmuramic acid 6-phosphate etherase